MSETPSLEVLAAQLNAHLVECTRAHEDVKDTLREIFSLIWKGVAALVALLFAILGFLAVQLYTVQVDKVHRLEAAAAAVASKPSPERSEHDSRP
jgi:hypothetical protein